MKGEGLSRADVCYQKTIEKKGTRGGVTSCLGLPNGGSEGVVAICRNLSGLTRFEGGGLPITVDIRREMTEIRELGAKTCQKMAYLRGGSGASMSCHELKQIVEMWRGERL